MEHNEIPMIWVKGIWEQAQTLDLIENLEDFGFNKIFSLDGIENSKNVGFSKNYSILPLG